MFIQIIQRFIASNCQLSTGNSDKTKNCTNSSALTRNLIKREKAQSKNRRARVLWNYCLMHIPVDGSVLVLMQRLNDERGDVVTPRFQIIVYLCLPFYCTWIFHRNITISRLIFKVNEYYWIQTIPWWSYLF